ncbi:type II secretion system F family protein [Patescibacteria group bacterium]|nr:type II secretion system F family protein [Patescibacteria group bacterium]
MKFNYQARTKTGEIQTGVVDASNREAAFDVLKTHGFYVTALQKTTAIPFYAQKLKFIERVSKKDIVLFSRQISIMFKSNVPIVESFRAIAKQTRKSIFREKILKLAEEIEGGSSLSKSLSLYPKLFTPFYINMVRSGEASGKLSDVFLYLADYLEKEYSFRSKIRGAMVYPLFILVVFIAVVALIMVYVIPQLSEVLEGTGQELPLATRVVMAVSAFLKKLWWVVLIILIGSAVGLYQFAKSKTGKKFFDRNLVKLPILGNFLKKLYLGRCALNLSTLISGGVPISQALQITGEVVNSDLYKGLLLETQDQVKKGETISSVLERYPSLVFPLFYQMITVGEKTGSLDTSLMNVVDFYQEDVDRSLDNFVRLLEPIFIIILGGVVAGLMGAVLMPLYSMGV